MSTFTNGTQLTLQDVEGEAYGLFATNAVGVAGFTMLVWDHIITLDDEVNVIWKRPQGRKNGPLIYIFLILRYFAPLAYTVQLCSYFFPPSIWTPEVCDHYVAFEGAIIVVVLGLVALLMMIRVCAMYARSWKVLAILGSLFILQFTIQGWLQTRTHPVHHHFSTNIAGCSMLFDESLGGWPTASAWLPVIYDTAVFILTVYKTANILRRSHRHAVHGSWIARTLLRDGALYYLAIVASNVPLIIMIVAAPDPIKNIAAQLEAFVTVTMMSRITLSLRREDAAWRVGSIHADEEHQRTSLGFAPKRRTQDDSAITNSDFDFQSKMSNGTFVSDSGKSIELYARFQRKLALPTPIIEEDGADYFARRAGHDSTPESWCSTTPPYPSACQ
ncbi:hypothetical protein AURDEDRAFT_168067 [Auricularia subglabra TFB-10046 SS5]|nr:hypothetical protein AURDEDRAFT_168067 [Auricularia subglabra TFB-10046 SS5]